MSSNEGLIKYVCDLETTGIKSDYNEVIEISIIRCKDRVQLTEFIKPDYPERSSYDALKIQNKTMQDLEKGNPKIEIVNKVNRFFEEDKGTPNSRCIIGHNIISFDKRFLFALWESCGFVFPANYWLDTMQLTREYAKQQEIKKPKVNLQASCDLLGVKKIATAHASKMDTRNTYLLYNALIAKGIDYLPFIKNASHLPKKDERDDFDLIDFSQEDIEEL